MRFVAVPFLHILGHINVHACFDEQILQLSVITKLLITQGRHQHRIDTVFFYHTNQVVVYGVHFLTHKVAVGKTFFVGYETKEPILLWLLCGDVLSQSHATFTHTINKRSLSLFGVEHRVVNTLYHDAEGPQQNGGHKVD